MISNHYIVLHCSFNNAAFYQKNIESFRVKFVKKTMAFDVNSLNFRENFPKISAVLTPTDRAVQTQTDMSLGAPVKPN